MCLKKIFVVVILVVGMLPTSQVLASMVVPAMDPVGLTFVDNNNDESISFNSVMLSLNQANIDLLYTYDSETLNTLSPRYSFTGQVLDIKHYNYSEPGLQTKDMFFEMQLPDDEEPATADVYFLGNPENIYGLETYHTVLLVWEGAKIQLLTSFRDSFAMVHTPIPSAAFLLSSGFGLFVFMRQRKSYLS